MRGPFVRYNKKWDLKAPAWQMTSSCGVTVAKFSDWRSLKKEKIVEVLL